MNNETNTTVVSENVEPFAGSREEDQTFIEKWGKVILASVVGIMLGFILNWACCAFIGIESLSYFPTGNANAVAKFKEAWQAYKNNVTQ